jgi:hypothetical protein
MKKLIIAATVLALAGMSVSTARANHSSAATAGAIFTGVVAGAAIASALNSRKVVSVSYGPVVPVYCAPAPRVVYAPAPIVYAPRPVIVYPSPVIVTRAPVVSYRHVYHPGPPRGHPHGYYPVRCR